MQTILRRCKFVLFSFLIVFATRCSDSDELPSGEYTTGVFVVNEGNFGEADGSISYYNRSTGEVRQDLFGRENSNRALGDVVQSIATHQNFTYIVVNNSNKVEVVDANTFKAVYTVNDVRLPRYMTIHGNKAYITEWVSFTDPGRVSILDLDTRVVEGTVTTDYGAEQLLVHNNKLYVSNNFSNTVSVVNLSSKTLLKNILVGPSPSALLIDKDNTLWVVSNGGYDANYNPLNNGAFYQINTTTDEVERSISLNINLSGKVAINGNKDCLLYTSPSPRDRTRSRMPSSA